MISSADANSETSSLSSARRARGARQTAGPELAAGEELVRSLVPDHSSRPICRKGACLQSTSRSRPPGMWGHVVGAHLLWPSYCGLPVSVPRQSWLRHWLVSKGQCAHVRCTLVHHASSPSSPLQHGAFRQTDRRCRSHFVMPLAKRPPQRCWTQHTQNDDDATHSSTEHETLRCRDSPSSCAGPGCSGTYGAQVQV